MNGMDGNWSGNASPRAVRVLITPSSFLLTEQETNEMGGNACTRGKNLKTHKYPSRTVPYTVYCCVCLNSATLFPALVYLCNNSKVVVRRITSAYSNLQAANNNVSLLGFTSREQRTESSSLGVFRLHRHPLFPQKDSTSLLCRSVLTS